MPESEDLEETPLLKHCQDESYDSSEADSYVQAISESPIEVTVDTPLSSFFWIELSLFANVFLSGFDGTVTASIYTTIGDEFHSSSMASWITTSYLITSTAFQPLYGSFSDILGRRTCLIGGTLIFALGCLGCGVSSDIIILNIARAIAGIGGGGLVTMATIINSDIIHPSERGKWQAFQNVLLGFGGICGASFGGAIAEYLGWRWCFLFQVPIGVVGIVIAYRNVCNPAHVQGSTRKGWQHIDLGGSITLVIALTLQLFFLTLGGSHMPWGDIRLVLILIAGILFLILFIWIENVTTAVPVVPPTLVQGSFSHIILEIGFLVGIASYAYLFILPMLFQIVLHDSVPQSGLRLAVPSLFTPVGGLVAGYFMSKGTSHLFKLVIIGCSLMLLGNYLSLWIDEGGQDWLIGLYLVPSNLGQGIVFPSSLFSFIHHFGKDQQAIATSTAYLFRSIGSVWGVAGSSAIIHQVLYRSAHQSLSDLLIPQHEISLILREVSEDISSIKTLEPRIAGCIQSGYTAGIRSAQNFCCICCLLSLLICARKWLGRIKSSID